MEQDSAFLVKHEEHKANEEEEFKRDVQTMLGQPPIVKRVPRSPESSAKIYALLMGTPEQVRGVVTHWLVHYF